MTRRPVPSPTREEHMRAEARAVAIGGKACPCCCRVYTRDQFLALRFRGLHLSESDPRGVQCCEGHGPDLVLRDCVCGSSIAIEVHCVHSHAKEAA